MQQLLSYKNYKVLSKENPKLNDLGQQHDTLMKEFNELNKIIYQEVPSSNPGKKESEKYNSLGRKADELQKRMLQWELEARDVILKPGIRITSESEISDDDKQEIIEQLIRSLSMAKQDMSEARQTLSNNHNHLVQMAKSNASMALAQSSYAIGKKSYKWAIVGVIFAIMSIVLSIIFYLI